MSDNSNSDTESDEQTVAELKERIGELEDRVEQQEQSQGASRRQFLGSLTGIASAGAAGYYLGTQRASAAPSWGSASGQMGTQSTPLQQVIAQTGTFQSLSTDSLNITEQVNYWPVVRTDPAEELDTTSPASSYTTLTLSSVPSDASVALIDATAEGDGTADRGQISFREGGSSRPFDRIFRFWAGHQAFTERDTFEIPLNDNNEIEYRDDDGNTARLVINSVGFY